MTQRHTRFKAFTGELAEDKALGSITADIERFVREAKVSPKSIGVEYLEGARKIVMTLGYRDDQPAQDVRVSCVKLGKMDLVNDLAGLEQAMTRAAEAQGDVICHELYITEDGQFFMVFLATVGPPT